MEIKTLFIQDYNQLRLQIDSIEKLNKQTEPFGLKLTQKQIEQMMMHRFDVLQKTNRMEFGEGIIVKLIEAFCDSPYIWQDNYADTINELQTIFYYFKGEAHEMLSDDELIDTMRAVFNGKAQGSLSYLAGTALEKLCFGYRGGVTEVEDVLNNGDVDEDDERNRLSLNEIDESVEDGLQILQAKLFKFMSKHIKKYTMNDSSSVPKEIAEQLMQSVLFVLGIKEKITEADIKRLIVSNMDEAFEEGQEQIRRKMISAKKLWRIACLSAPGIENQSYHDTLLNMKLFWEKYDMQFFAHEIPCDIDYQLCIPVSNSLLGVDYLTEWLTRLLAEQALIGQFDIERCVKLLSVFCPDYRGLLINLFEPIATNAIGLAVVHGDIYGLSITPEICEQIDALLFGISKDSRVEKLQTAAVRVCETLGLHNQRTRAYLVEYAQHLESRVFEALMHRKVNHVFLSLES